MDVYQAILRPLLFSVLKSNPETTHYQVMTALAWLNEHRHHSTAQWLRSQLQMTLRLDSDRLRQDLWGISFPNPVGLAAGFDKDGVAAQIWGDFGFGFAELGTVTQHAQPGNPKPRLFRLLADQAVLNRMGFNNEGAAALAQRLAHFADQSDHAAQVSNLPNPFAPAIQGTIPLGINLGKSKVTPLETAADDYDASFQQLAPWGNYFVVNVSSPNTPGLRSLQARDQLAPILERLQTRNQAGAQPQHPLLLKIAPDLDWAEIDDIIDLVREFQLAGIIATNTTIARTGLQTQTLSATGRSLLEEAGGISGLPLRQRATAVIRYLYQQTQGQIPIIGVGGIFSAEDAWEKITAGASLIQLYTGWIYEGPWLVRRILTGLLQKLDEHQLPSLPAAVGLNAKAHFGEN